MTYRECQVSSRLFAVLFFAVLLFTACGHATETFLTKGEEYLQKRKFHDALMQFRSAVESDSTSSRAHWGLARSYENLGQFSEALEELRKTVDLDSQNLEAKAKLGNYFLLITPPMTDEAEKVRDEILAIDPQFIEGHMLTAAIMATQGLPDSDVIGAVNRAIKLNPKRIESYISLQRLYMTRENGEEAERAIKAGIAESPDSVLGHIEYGRFLMYLNRDDEAETQFNKAISFDEANIEAREAIAEFFLLSRQLDKADQAYLKLTEIQENSPESRVVLAEFYQKSGRAAESLAVLEQILTDTPEYAIARYRLGQVYLDRKDHAKVNEQLDALFKINSNDTEALMLRSRLRLQENLPDEAIKDLEDVLKKHPSGREPLYLMAQARLAAGQIDQANAFIVDLERYHPTDLKAGILRIQSAFTAGDAQDAFKLACSLLEKVGNAIPDAVNSPLTLQELRLRALSSRGLANLDLMKLEDARLDLENVVSSSPKSSTAAVNLARVYVAERKFDLARELYERASGLDPLSFDAVSGLVDTLIRLGQLDLAQAKTDEMILSHAGNPTFVAGLHYLKSTIYAAEKNSAGSERELIAAINTDSNYLPAYTGYAALLVQQNRTDEAAAQYQRMIELRPTAQIYTLLGMLEDSRGRFELAEAAYRKALEADPDLPIAANNLAWLIVEQHGNLDEALQLATAAVNKNPSVPGFHDTLGWVYMQKGLTSPAVEKLKRAVVLEDAGVKKTGTSPNAGYRLRLGMALAKAGDRSGARREAEASLRFPNSLSQREIMDARGILAGSN